MASINTFTIVGNVTKDVELRYTPSGTPAVTFTVAVDNVYYDRDGKKHEETDFIPVTTYGKQAENDAKFLKKGSMVAVMGRIRSWYKADERKGGFNFEAENVLTDESRMSRLRQKLLDKLEGIVRESVK